MRREGKGCVEAKKEKTEQNKDPQKDLLVNESPAARRPCYCLRSNKAERGPRIQTGIARAGCTYTMYFSLSGRNPLFSLFSAPKPRSNTGVGTVLQASTCASPPAQTEGLGKEATRDLGNIDVAQGLGYVLDEAEK